MDGPAAVWQQAAEYFDRNVTSLDDEQVGRPSPCGEWTVGEVVDHAVSSQAGIASILGAEVSADAGWPAVRDAMAATLADPSNLVGDTPPEVMGGMPKHQLLGIAIGDALLHGWDVARATGGDENMPPAAVEAVLMGLQRMPEARLRSPGVFGPAVEVGEDASVQDRLLGFSGRRP